MYSGSKRITEKLYFIIRALSVALVIISTRLFWLQIVRSYVFLQKGERNYVRYQTVESLRGNILDSKNRLLATNKPITDVYWMGSGKKILNQEQLHELELLEKVYGKDLDRNALLAAEKKSKRLLLIHDFSLEQLSGLVEKLPQYRYLDLSTHFKRYYPYDSVASHVVGYLGTIDDSHEGKMGLEKMLEEQLHGTPGKKLYMINSHGKYVSHQDIVAADAGVDSVTTIDLDIQVCAEKAFPEKESGVFILMNPQTGAIKALVSRPDFNPNVFLDPLDNDQWQLLQEKKPFLNRACNACYPPASLFKLVTMAAGLELGLVKESDSWYCSGKYMFANRAYHCAHQEGHGVLSTHQAMVHSCNILFFDIGKRIKIDTLADYAARFGLGEKTDILFYEKTGLVPTSQWKRRVKKEPWWPGETLSAAIGQSYLLVTPIQMLRMIASISQGYLVKPRILEAEEVVQRPLGISEQTLVFLRKALREVAVSGTARALSRVKNVEIIAKTGTAQTSDLSKRDMGKQFVEHGWLIAHFQYQDQEPLALAILIENVGTSRVAVEIARLFLEEYTKKISFKNSAAYV